MGISKVIYGGTTLIDLTNDTVTPETLLSGATAHGADGSLITGTAVQGHQVVDDSGTPLTQRSKLKISGQAVTDDAENGQTILEPVHKEVTQSDWNAMTAEEKEDPNYEYFLPWATDPGSGRHQIKDGDGNEFSDRPNLQFMGLLIEDDPLTNTTKIFTWRAILSISTTSESLYGKTITVKKSGVSVGTTTFSNQGTATFNVHEAGTYQCYCEDYVSSDVVVTTETTYSVTIQAGLDLSSWITAGSTTDYPLNPSSYANFAALEADEAAIRQLMLVHNAVDYLATAGADDALIEDVINSDICAKWINLSDYALDILSANANIKSVMDEADKYGYGEIGAVNIATDTAKVTASGQYSSDYAASKAINTTPASGNKGWISPSGGSNAYLDYDCGEDVSIAYINIGYCASSGASTTARYKIQGKKNGSSEWVDLTNEYTSILQNQWSKLTLIVSDTFRYYRLLEIERAVGGSGWVIQYCNYQPLGNVPIMISDSAPYGTVRSSGANSGSEAYKAFDGNTSTYFMTSTHDLSTNFWVSYKAANPIIPKKAYVQLYCLDGNAVTTKFKIQGSNDGFVSDIHDVSAEITCTVAASADVRPYNPVEVSINTNVYYIEYRIMRTYSSHDTRFAVVTLQFYGRELKPLVPTMTDNTHPRYEVFDSDNKQQTYRAFDNNTSTNHSVYAINPGFIGIDFKEKFKVNSLDISLAWSSSWATVSNIVLKLQGSDDNSTWEDILTITGLSSTDTSKHRYSFNESEYRYYRIYTETGTALSSTGDGRNRILVLTDVQLYGPDYSEKEFASGSNRLTIYDHGVECVSMIALYDGSAIATKESNQLYGNTTASGTPSFAFITSVQVNFPSGKYSLLCGKVGNKANGPASYSTFFYGVKSTGTYTYSDSTLAAEVGVTPSVLSGGALETALDVSNITGDYYVLLCAKSNNQTREVSCVEMWLE